MYWPVLINAPINIKPGKGGGGCRQGWGFVSVTPNFCKTPMVWVSKNHQIKFKVPTPGTQNTSNLPFPGPGNKAITKGSENETWVL